MKCTDPKTVLLSLKLSEATRKTQLLQLSKRLDWRGKCHVSTHMDIVSNILPNYN